MSGEGRTPLAVIDIVGLTPALLGEHTPNLKRLLAEGAGGPLRGTFPALTTSAQASMLTGMPPTQHGIVGNGWYWREQAEVRFWQQPDQLVQAPKVWETLKQRLPGFTCSKLFWWYNLYGRVDWSVTPRPHYPADGRKIVGLDSEPPGLHAELEAELGPFPFFNFWGPKSDIRSSRWIAQAASLESRRHRPDLQLVYLPHLDYNLQRLGPDDPAISADLQAIDAVAGELIDQLRGEGAAVMVVSEYGIRPVQRPVHLNRVLREQGLVRVRESLGWEVLEPGACRAFAVADHQVAHVYVRDAADLAAVREVLAGCPGVAEVLDTAGKRALGIDHPRAGDLVAVAEPDAWFTYYYWLDDARAPDFARTVDIHRKPGYDPLELFLDPNLRLPQLKVAWRLLQKTLGFRMLMDVIPLDPALVHGSHGRLEQAPDQGPMLITSDARLFAPGLGHTDVHDLILRHFGVAA